MDDPQIERSGPVCLQIDGLARWIATQEQIFIERVEIGPGLHLDDGEVFPVEEVEVPLVLEKGPFDRDRFLVVERGAVLEVWRQVGIAEAFSNQ